MRCRGSKKIVQLTQRHGLILNLGSGKDWREDCLNAENDRLAKENVEILNNADATIFRGEQTLKDLDDKITEEQKQELKGIIETLRESYNNKDIDKIKQFMDDLNQKFQEVSQKLYEQTQDDSQEQHSDVEFEEVK